ncbi:hypothetical protein [Nostoc sp.]|uniref:hypothetical protein n=1 Tax=Nostoc sp. TaxID=1180 RepID=UPI002FF5726B
MRQIQFEELPSRVVVVTWQNGDKQIFFGEDAVALIKAIENTTTSINKQCSCQQRKL